MEVDVWDIIAISLGIVNVILEIYTFNVSGAIGWGLAVFLYFCLMRGEVDSHKNKKPKEDKENV